MSQPESEQRSIAEREDGLRREILSQVLHESPDAYSEDELIRAMAGECPGFRERDELEISIASLIRAGLLTRNGKLLHPTKAAREFGLLAGFP